MKIKKLIICFLFIFVLGILGSCTDDITKDPPTNPDNPSINNPTTRTFKVIYFSCTNNTKKVATKIAEYLDCDIEEIIPLEPYTDEDLTYQNNSSRATIEQRDPLARPQIKNTINIDDVNTIFLGYPIWWGGLPKIIYTFLESYNLENYTIIPFCTSGSTSISSSINEIKNLAKLAEVLDGKRFTSNVTTTEIKNFIDNLNL